MSKKNDIVLAALNLLGRNGVHATPMSAIAKEAGTGMGTIYNYFPTKEILINYIFVYIKTEEKKLFSTFVSTKDLRVQFKEYYSVAVQFYKDNVQYFQFIEQLHASPIITEESRDFALKAIGSVYHLIEKGKELGVVKDMQTKELLQFIAGSVISHLRWHFRDESEDKASLSNLVQMVWDAIKK
ncbi:TetR/AcrR family transcriptional regulator [Tenacibaculum sp. M341]|uniref:TetR/AcrR family transcriptional regulator n=1 Tax=Tenacibaculum sp. M341 TaxID=2530339 RepID=UPI0010504049|nr:TetR/AcrR family transcriptional regulator [Tenacibaculum sp. M341]TCI85303.1 TetR/AcrR family transcriptional regulator [Tenacibaculum sp. M341]